MKKIPEVATPDMLFPSGKFAYSADLVTEIEIHRKELIFENLALREELVELRLCLKQAYEEMRNQDGEVVLAGWTASAHKLLYAYYPSLESEDTEVGCCFPGRCCMPGEHLRSECHTAEMMQQMIEDGEA